MITRHLRSLRPIRAALAAGLLSASALAAVALPAAVQAQASRVDEAAAALRGITTLKADFTQIDRNGRSVTGELTLKRPGRIRFQYEKSVPMLIVGDGKALTVIDYQVRQVQRWPIRNSPLGALLDPTRDVAKYAREVPTGNGNVISLEIRDAKHPEYGTITLIFVRNGGAPGGWQLDSWVALDAQSNRTLIRLSHQKYGVAVSDDAFRFVDPRPAIHRAG